LGSAAAEAFAELFEHVPDAVFFVKDRAGRYLAVNRSLVERCGLREKSENCTGIRAVAKVGVSPRSCRCSTTRARSWGSWGSRGT